MNQMGEQKWVFLRSTMKSDYLLCPHMLAHGNHPIWIQELLQHGCATMLQWAPACLHARVTTSNILVD